MQSRHPPTDAHSGRRPNATAMFAAACGLRGPLRFMVENTETGQSQTFDVVEPFVLIGQSPGCHLRLLHPDVSYRHAYCQVLQGRLYVYDLDTEHGTVWGAGLRREGPLTPDSRLQIGPFIVRLSRAPAFTCSLQPTPDDWQPENEPLENVRLWFENATGRSSHNSLRPLRRHITILGRSNRSHLKLSNSSVSKTHCVIVRTDVGYWVVDLLGRNGTLLNGQPVRFAPIGPDDSLTAGRFRMRIRELIQAEPGDDPELDAAAVDAPGADAGTPFPAEPTRPPVVVQTSPPDDDGPERQLVRSQQSLAFHSSKLPELSIADGPPRATSDALILAMMEQFSNLQQQLLAHTQQQMSMLTEMFATLHKAQNDAVMEQLQRIQEITSELNELKARKQVPDGESDVRPRASIPETECSASAMPMQDVAAAPPELRPPTHAEDAAPSEVLPDQISATFSPGLDVATPPNPGAAADDSDVVPIGDALPHFEGDIGCGASRGAAAHGSATAGDSRCAAPLRPSARLQSVSSQRHDAMDHARLTLRISELERERKSHWKKLMQLVGAARDD